MLLVRLLQLQLDRRQQRRLRPLLQGELKIVTITLMLQNLELVVIGSDQPAHHAGVSHHARQLRLGRFEVRLRCRNIRLHAAYIGLHTGNIGRNSADLLRVRRLLLLQPGRLRPLRRNNALRLQLELLLSHAHALPQRLARRPQPCIGRLQLLGQFRVLLVCCRNLLLRRGKMVL